MTVVLHHQKHENFSFDRKGIITIKSHSTTNDTFNLCVASEVYFVFV